VRRCTIKIGETKEKTTSYARNLLQVYAYVPQHLVASYAPRRGRRMLGLHEVNQECILIKTLQKVYIKNAVLTE
jgi:hypothetical protein